MLSLYIWNRYIRERLPKDIPFILTNLGFYILLYICILYLVLSVSLIVNHKSENSFINNALNIIYKPLKLLDESIKNNNIIKPYYEKLLLEIVIVTRDMLVKIFENPFLNLSIFFQIFPRIILVLTLIVDVFWFQQLYYIYKVIFISILILFGKYFIYSLKYAKEQYIQILENMADTILTNHHLPDEESSLMNSRTIREFIDIQTEALVYEDLKYRYIALDHNILLEETKNTIFEGFLEIAIMLSVYIEEYHCAEKYSRIRYIKIFIFTMYFICWFVILLLSIQVSDMNLIFSCILICNEMLEPFSDTKL